MAQILLPSAAVLRVAAPSDKTFVRSLAKKFSAEVGFLPDAALDWYLENAGVQLAMENDEPAGYLLGRDQLRWNIAIRPIFQAAIHFDAQRMHHGLALVTRREADAVEAGQVAIQACCREELDANRFWLAAGFEQICRMNPNNARGRPVICWRKQITPFRPKWFTAPPPRSGIRAATTVLATAKP
jgi:hypothetical protein